jgi:uncharacterized protein (TIGR00304 family)
MLELVFVGIGLIVAGFLVVLMSTAMSGRSSEEERRTEVRGGGIIMIGPIPIIFGSDAKWASAAIVLAIVLIVIVLLFGVLIGR